jgi:hypothetical protein
VALNFPSSPTIGDVYTDTTSGFSYEWDGTVWKSYTPASVNNILVLDDISGSFNGVTDTFALTSSGNPVGPTNAQQLRIVLGGVIQSPGTDYNVSGSNIVFTTAPDAALEFSGVSLGKAFALANNIANVYNRQTYTATAGQTLFAFASLYTVGFLDVYRNGVKLTAGTDFTATTGNDFTLTVAANLSDEVEAIGYKVSTLVSNNGELTNLYVTGISTLGVTNASNLNVTGIGTINTLNVTGTSTLGIVTGATYYGDGSNLTGVISGVEIKEEGSSVGAGITSINFVGSDITATASGAGATVTVSVAAAFNELDAALFN